MSSNEEEDELTDIEDIPQLNNNDIEGGESDYSFIDMRVAKRMAIAYLFVNEFNATEDEKQWPEIARVIKEKLSIPSGTKIKYVFLEVIQCKKAKKEYVGGHRTLGTFGKPPIITTNSIEAQIIADCLEEGLSMSLTLQILNKHAEENGIPSFTIGPIKTICKKLRARRAIIKKQKQGSRDKNSKWARARFRWIIQLLIRFGHLES